MKNASEFFLGRNDLNAFRSIDCQAKSSIRSIEGRVISYPSTTRCKKPSSGGVVVENFNK